MATIGQSLPQPEQGWKRFDDRNSIISKTAHDVINNENAYDGSYTLFKSGVNSKASFSFRGTKIRIIGLSNLAQYRPAEVKIKIDNIEYTYNERASAITWTSLVFELDNLNQGVHSVDIQGVSTVGGATFYLDAIDIDEDGELLPPKRDIGDILSQPDYGWRRYEETDYNFSYSSGWTNFTSSSTSGGTDKRTTIIGETIRFNFIGDSLRIISPMNNNLSDSLKISIDGIEEEFSERNPTLKWRVLVYEKTNLENKIHSVVITSNSTATNIFDALDLPQDATLLAPPRSIGEYLPRPDMGWKRYDDTNAFFQYEGVWSIDTVNTGAYNQRHRWSNSINSKIIFNFYGSKLRVLSALNSNGDKNAKIIIDGEEYQFNQSGTLLYQILVFEKEDLSNGFHKVEVIKDQSTTSTYLYFDAIDINDDGYLVRPDYFDTDYPEPLRSNGVAWFGFDEESGNIYDKLGGEYFGTVTGASRVDGWNGYGKSLSLKGSPQFLSFNNPIFPIGEKTIRFKIKPSSSMPVSSTVRLLDATANTTSTAGLSIILIGGNIRFIIRSGGIVSFVDSSNKVIYDKWNDILISYTGKSEKANVKISVNGVENPYYLDRNDANSYGNLFIGKMNPALSSVTNASEYYNGMIDDLQVFNKILSPLDFEQKLLSVKTTDNKNLVLSPTSTRIKEVPNTGESTLIAQDGVIKDIDSAIDRPQIDLTRASTEYEVVSVDNTALGNGKQFNQQAIDNFKTITIEDNY